MLEVGYGPDVHGRKTLARTVVPGAKERYAPAGNLRPCGGTHPGKAPRSPGTLKGFRNSQCLSPVVADKDGIELYPKSLIQSFNDTLIANTLSLMRWNRLESGPEE